MARASASLTRIVVAERGRVIRRRKGRKMTLAPRLSATTTRTTRKRAVGRELTDAEVFRAKLRAIAAGAMATSGASGTGLDKGD